MARAVVCVAGTMKVAEKVVAELRNAGFSGADVSVLLPRHDGETDGDSNGHADEKDAEALVGCSPSPKCGSLEFPGVAPFTAAGPILDVLARLDPKNDPLFHAMSEMGIPEIEAKRYEAKLEEGNILISIHTSNTEERAVARRIFERAGGDYISYTTERR